MLVPINWIKEYTAVDADVETFCDRMIMSGSNIETVEHFGEGISKVVVGRILSIEKHPDADKLVICQLDVGQGEPLQIVTGAANIAEGDYVPVATHGSKIPGPLHGQLKQEGGVTIKKGKLRGVESNGMLCSASELGFADKVVPVVHKDGIWILNSAPGMEYTPGTDIVTAMGLVDDVVDFEITPNRPDCLSMIGMAREAAATFDKPLSYPDVICLAEDDKAKEYIEVEVKRPDLCRRYVARVVKDVKIEQSPWWLQKRLIYAGMRPINNIVDITNYVMLEYGHPLHAFDIRSIAGSKITVDVASEGEKFTTLDGNERTLTSDMLMIRDQEKAIGLAGVMGGLNSEIEEDTTMIVVEAANFDADNIRATSKKLGLRTEASARYEKGLDPNLSEEAADRVCRLIEILGAGTVTRGRVDIYPEKVTAQPMDVRVSRVNQVLGIELPAKEMEKIFRRLEMDTLHLGDHLRVTPPTVRLDLMEEVDYIEEVGRIYGYDRMPVTIPKGNNQAGKPAKQTRRDLAKEALTGMGYNEIQTYSFVSPKGLDKVRIAEDAPERKLVKLINPLGEDTSVMRTLLAPNMLEVLARNDSRNIAHVRAFELGNTFFNILDNDEHLPEEHDSLCMAVYGPGETFFTLKGGVVELLSKLGIQAEFEACSDRAAFHPGRCAKLFCKGEPLGIMGELHPETAENYGLSVKAYLCELSFDAICRMADTEKAYKPLPKYPSTARDIALVVKEEDTVGRIEALIRRTGGGILEDVALFDVYRGKPIQTGMKSVAFSLTYRAADHTLTDEEVGKVHDKVLAELKSELNAVLREM